MPAERKEREVQGLIKAFEITFELSRNTVRGLLRSEGLAELVGSRGTLREAFRVELIEAGSRWMVMVQDRTLTSHSCNRATIAPQGPPHRTASIFIPSLACRRRRAMHCWEF